MILYQFKAHKHAGCEALLAFSWTLTGATTKGSPHFPSCGTKKVSQKPLYIRVGP
jgi:hypothetical protein